LDGISSTIGIVAVCATTTGLRTYARVRGAEEAGASSSLIRGEGREWRKGADSRGPPPK